MRLKLDMEAELETIRMRYEAKIHTMEQAYQLA